jgi:hypothetical protein
VRKFINIINEANQKTVSTDFIKQYIATQDGRVLHQDYIDYIDTFKGFTLEKIPTDSIKSDLEGLDHSKVDRYKEMDLTNSPAVVIADGYILDGYHRVNAAKAMKIPYMKAYVGIK